MKIKSFISILLIAVLITITGCSNEEEKNQALAKSLDANQKIETSKAKGYQEWAESTHGFLKELKLIRKPVLRNTHIALVGPSVVMD